MSRQSKYKPGLRFGAWTLVRRVPGKRHWVARCDCGTESEINVTSAAKGGTTRCRKCAGRKISKYLLTPGDRFNSWTVVRKGSGRGWVVRCDCGIERSYEASILARGRIKHCNRCMLSARNKAMAKHGMAGTRTHKAWSHMVSRCLNEKDKFFMDYGGRGITVCERWLDFKSFFEDMGECPEGLTLERRDNSKGYSPLNCIWASWTEQANNKRSNKYLEYKGETDTLANWSRRLGFDYSRVKARINALGWPVEKAFESQLYNRSDSN